MPLFFRFINVGQSFSNYFYNYYDDLDFDLEAVCSAKIRNDMAIVDLEMSQPFILMIQRDVRVTFVEQLGMLGKL